MIIVYLILGIGNIFMAGKLWGIIDIGNTDGTHVEWHIYAWAVCNVIIGVYMLISAVGKSGGV